MGYISIASAHDWYYVIPQSETVRDLMVWPLALWALPSAGGDVIGLIANPSSDEDQQAMGQAPRRLLAIPPLPGVYKHVKDLTVEERAAAQHPVAVVNHQLHTISKQLLTQNGPSGP